jgi:hypothetical protein
MAKNWKLTDKIILFMTTIGTHITELRNGIAQTLFVIGNSPFSWFLFPILLGLALVVVLSVLHTLFVGWVLYLLWGWFMVPYGVPAYPIAVFCGVSLIYTILHHRELPWDAVGTPQILIMILRRFTSPIGMLFIGILTHELIKAFAS